MSELYSNLTGQELDRGEAVNDSILFTLLAPSAMLGKKAIGNTAKAVKHIAKEIKDEIKSIDYKTMLGVGLKINDGVKRKFLTDFGVQRYLQKNYPKAYNEYLNNMGSAQGLPKSEKEQWHNYYKNNLMHNEYEVSNYPNVKVNRKNFKKDYTHNLPEYENLPEQLRRSEYGFTTNYNQESDRLYDHLLNVNKNTIKDFLSEVVLKNNNKPAHNYKMMKHLNKGDKI